MRVFVKHWRRLMPWLFLLFGMTSVALATPVKAIPLAPGETLRVRFEQPSSPNFPNPGIPPDNLDNVFDRRAGVMARGMWYTEADLQALLESIRP